MALTVRFSPEVQQRAAQYCRDLGISVNALVAIAITDYMDRRLAGAKVRADASAVNPDIDQGGGLPPPVDRPRVPTLTRQQRRALARQGGKSRTDATPEGKVAT